MAAANLVPPPADDLEVFPMDDAYLTTLAPEVRSAIERAEARIANGTAQLVPHAEVDRRLEEQRRQKAG